MKKSIYVKKYKDKYIFLLLGSTACFIILYNYKANASIGVYKNVLSTMSANIRRNNPNMPVGNRLVLLNQMARRYLQIIRNEGIVQRTRIRREIGSK